MTIMKRGDSNRPRVLDTITSALCARAIISMPARGRRMVSNMLSPTRWNSAPDVSCTPRPRSSQHSMSRAARNRCTTSNILRAARCTSATINAHMTPALGRPIFASMTARRQSPHLRWHGRHRQEVLLPLLLHVASVPLLPKAVRRLYSASKVAMKTW